MQQLTVNCKETTVDVDRDPQLSYKKHDRHKHRQCVTLIAISTMPFLKLNLTNCAKMATCQKETSVYGAHEMEL